jgi:NAD(P)-dependent dehydrogenase (short-subunit alcohol dehydrogenase family)
MGLKHQVPAILASGGSGSIINNAALPGVVGAPLDGKLQAAAMNPLERLSQPEEIAAFVAFLLSDESANPKARLTSGAVAPFPKLRGSVAGTGFEPVKAMPAILQVASASPRWFHPVPT